MSVIHNDLLLATDEATGYNLTKSLRFRSSASAYLNRTFSTPTDAKTFTWSGWVKRGALGTLQYMFCAGTSSGTAALSWTTSNTLEFYGYTSPSTIFDLITTQVFRDPSAWYHIVAVYDSSQATSSNRVKLYVNGVQITAFGTSTYPSQNATSLLNTAVTHTYFARYTGSSYADTNSDAYLTEVNFIDGQALTPSSFGETDTTTGVWKAKRYTGTYGTNGFYLPFTDVATTSGSNAGLGKDFSGNGNYWNTNNISVTSGATYDSMTDVPTLTSATAANYATLNPLSNQGNGTISGANLNYVSSAAAWKSAAGTMFMSSGQWYYECTVINFSSSLMVGICNTSLTNFNDYAGDSANSWSVQGNASGTNKWNNNSSTSIAPGEATSTGDVFMVAFDVAAAKVWFGKNGTWYSSGDPAAGTNAAFTNLTGSIGAMISSVDTSCTLAINFGQRPFAYTPPTGYVALNTYNLPDSTIVAGNTVMDATLYTGTGSSLTITNAGSFKPDFLWLKTRQSGSHALIDSVRGVNKVVNSNNTDAENTSTTGTGLTSFNSNGFTLGSNNSGTGTTNYIGDTFVAWQWQAGQGTTSSNTSGSITSTTSVNASAGFSIVTYTGTATAATIGHGLGVAPKMIIVKRRDSAGNNIPVYHISTGAANVPYLENTTGYFTRSGNFNDTAPTSTVFSVGGTGQSDYTNTNASGGTYVAYCWAEIAGFSKFGSYTGNGSTDGPFVYTGFRPKFVMYKNSSAVNSWIIEDTSRLGYNASNYNLYPNLSNAEGSYTGVDILSNGFKMRNADSGFNDSGNTYIYAAFAENPFKNSLAR